MRATRRTKELGSNRWSTVRFLDLLFDIDIVLTSVGLVPSVSMFIDVSDRYYPSPIPNLPTYTPTNLGSKSKKNHTGAIIGGVVGGVVFLAAAIVAGLCFWKPSFRQRFSKRKAPRALLAGRSHSTVGVSRSSGEVSGDEQKADAGQPRMAEEAPLLASGLENAGTANSRVSSERAPPRS